jgi:hypothetical protein
MALNPDSVRRLLEVDRSELDRLKAAANDLEDDSAFQLLNEATPYYEKAIAYLDSGKTYDALMGHFYLEGYLALALGEVKSTEELRKAINEVLGKLPATLKDE